MSLVLGSLESRLDHSLDSVDLGLVVAPDVPGNVEAVGGILGAECSDLPTEVVILLTLLVFVDPSNLACGGRAIGLGCGPLRSRRLDVPVVDSDSVWQGAEELATLRDPCM